MSRARKTAARKARQRSPIQVKAKSMADINSARFATMILESEWETTRRAVEDHMEQWMYGYK